MDYEKDRKEFTVIMGTLAEIYEKTMTPVKTRIYFDSLVRYSIEQVKMAVNKHNQDPKHGSFMPKPADLIRQLTDNETTVDDRAELAWMQVINAIGSVGSYGTLKMEDAQAMAAIKNLGSWSGLCQTKEADLQWKRKDFVLAYKTFENTPLEMLPSSLPGYEELHNKKVGDRKALGNIAGELLKLNLNKGDK